MRYPSLRLTPCDSASLEGLSMICGLPGSGKTSTTYSLTLQTLLDGRRTPPLGGILLAPTQAHVAHAVRLAAAQGRRDDLMLLRAHGHRLNLLHDAWRHGFSIESLTAMLMQSAHVLGRTGAGAPLGGDSYWLRAVEDMVRSILYLVTLAQPSLSLSDIHRAIHDAPNKGDLTRASWKASSSCYALLERARARVARARHPLHRHNLTMVEHFLQAWANLNDRTKSIIVNTFRTLISPLLYGELHQLCDAADTTLDLAWTWTRRKILVLDVPAEEFGESALAIQAMLKYYWQGLVRRRPMHRQAAPTWLVADEVELYATPSDLHFVAVSRNKGAIVVFVLHSLAELYDKLGRSAGDALLSYTRTFVFHASDPETALYAARLIGETWQPHVTQTATREAHVSGLFAWLWRLPIRLLGRSYGASWGQSTSTATRLTWQVLPHALTTLRTGGPAHDYLVDILVVQSGKIWSTGANYLKATLAQDFARPRRSLPSGGKGLLRPLLRVLLLEAKNPSPHRRNPYES